MAATKILLDSGPLVGFISETDQHHRWSAKVWNSLFDPLWTCEAVLSEAIFILQSDGNSTEPLLQLFERGLVRISFDVSSHQSDLWELFRKYADRPISLADACLVRMAELNDNCQIFTTDRDFLIYRRKGRGIIPLLAPF
jgi:predicted nucleic acid-binding protein